MLQLRTNLRTYGRPPYRVAVLHGGPGAPGYMAPVARELADDYGVLEPLQTADTLDGQIEELRQILEQHADTPVTLIGSSWGAVLGYLLAARHPDLVAKLIMVGSMPFAEQYVETIRSTRLSRMTEMEVAQLDILTAALDNPAISDKNPLLARLGRIIGRIEAYDATTLDIEVIEYQADINRKVWPAADALRRSGELVAMGTAIRCPVVGIHGDYDPHPAEGVEEPLSLVVSDFRFVLLRRCGHLPWLERQARDEFFRLLREEIDAA